MEKQKKILFKLLQITNLISSAEVKRSVLLRFYGDQIKLPPIKSFLFRSQAETEQKIEFQERVIERLWKYYKFTATQLIESI